MPAFICFHIFTASFIFSKIFTRFEVAFIPASFPCKHRWRRDQHLHCRFSGVLRFQMYFFKCNSKVYDLFVSWYDKRPEYVLYPSLSRIWNVSGSTKEAAFGRKNSHVTITWHAVVPCEHLYCRQVHAHHFSSRVWGTLVEEDEIWGQFLFEPRLHVECRVIV